MKLKVIRWIALIVASAIGIWILFGIIFIGANLINDFANGQPFAAGIGIIFLFVGMVLSFISIIIAWFNSKTGGILVTISSLLLILLPLEEITGEKWWQVYVLFIAGIMLLLYVHYDRWFLKNKGN